MERKLECKLFSTYTVKCNRMEQIAGLVNEEVDVLA